MPVVDRLRNSLLYTIHRREQRSICFLLKKGRCAVYPTQLATLQEAVLSSVLIVGTYGGFGNWLPAGEYRLGVGCHEMERHQIENPDLKEYRAKACKSSKERSPADSYDPYFGCVGCASQKGPLSWQHHNYSSSTVPMRFLCCKTSRCRLNWIE